MGGSEYQTSTGGAEEFEGESNHLITRPLRSSEVDINGELTDVIGTLDLETMRADEIAHTSDASEQGSAMTTIPASGSTVLDLKRKSQASERERNPPVKKAKLNFLGIRRVNFATVAIKRRILTETDSYAGLEVIIEAIMKGDADDNTERESTSAEPYKVSSDINMTEIHQFYHTHELNFGEEFKVRLYVQRVKDSNFFVTHFSGKSGQHAKQERLNAVTFFYRPGDIFFLVNNRSWMFVDWCTDYDFPNLMASRLLSADGHTSRKSRQLVGNTLSTDSVFKKSDYPSNLLQPEYVVNFEANLRADSSLYSLPLSIFENFDEDSKEILMKTMKAEVGAGYFKLLKSLDRVDFVPICHHLSLIRKGYPTYPFGRSPSSGAEPEKNTNTHEKWFVRTTPILTKNLTATLAWTVFNPNVHEHPKELQNFCVTHSHTKDFMRGDNFILSYRRQEKESLVEVHSFDVIPDLFEIIEAVKSSQIFKDRTTEKNGSKELDLVALLNKFFMTFKVGSVQKKPVRVLQYIEGFHLYIDKMFYWRINGMWWQVAQSFVTTVHLDFIKTLNDGRLIHPTEDAYLSHKWFSTNQQEAIKKVLLMEKKTIPWENIYNASYVLDKTNSCIIGDKVLFDNSIELFDVMKIVLDSSGKRTAYLYHVKNGLDMTRDTCSQIENAAATLRDISKDKWAGKLQEFYNKLQSEYPHNKEVMRNLNLLTLANFASVMENAIFVLAFIDGEKAKHIVTKYDRSLTKKTRSIYLEQKTKTVFSVDDIVEVIEYIDNNAGNKYEPKISLAKLCTILKLSDSSGSTECAKKIQDVLLDRNYIDSSFRPTPKFLSATTGDFQFGDYKSSVSKDIFHILSEFRSSYSSLVTKLEIIRTSMMPGGKFRICEIFADDDEDDGDKDRMHMEYARKFITEKHPNLRVDF